MKSQLTLVHVLSPLHPGIGQGAGVIDLPIAREKATSLPYLPGSSIKGALRTRLWQKDQLQAYREIFGSDLSEGENSRASSVLFSDQRLLLLPIRSLAGVFAWVTAPYVLHRFVRDLLDTQLKPPTQTLPSLTNVNQCLITSASKLEPMSDGRVYLEDFDLVDAQKDPTLTEWAGWLSGKLFPDEQETYWQYMLTEHLCLVHDDLFQFMAQHATEVMTRIRLKEDSKTVDDEAGGLWYEEALPTETILSGLAMITPIKNSKWSEAEIIKLLATLTESTLQLGGKATVGRGMCHVRLV